MTAQLESKPVEQPIPVAEVVNNTQQDKVQTNNEVKQEVETAPKNGKEWDNFREARKAERERAKEVERQGEKAREEAAAFKAALEATLNKPQPQYHHQEETEETEEQRIDKRVNEAIAKREIEIERLRKQQEEQELPHKLSRAFKDFDQVCSAENLDYLDYHYPEVAAAFAHMPNGYDKWSSIYGAVKRLIPNTDSRKDQVKAEKNFQKPQSGSNGMAQAGNNIPPIRLDERRKAENYARMTRTMRKLD